MVAVEVLVLHRLQASHQQVRRLAEGLGELACKPAGLAITETALRALADVLLGHLSLLFVPVGVGVMTHLALISQHGLRMAVALLLSTWIGLAVTALVLRALLPAPDTRSGTTKG